MNEKVIVIGSSTGGPGHLNIILNCLPDTYSTPIIIAQHMSLAFIPSFVKKLSNDFITYNIKRATHNMLVSKNTIYICANSMILKMDNNLLKLEEDKDTHKLLYTPNINSLFKSISFLTSTYHVLAVLLTGIGEDGAIGLDLLEKNGANCIAESEKSAIVYGMPKKAVELNSNIEVLDIHDISLKIKLFGEV